MLGWKMKRRRMKLFDDLLKIERGEIPEGDLDGDIDF
jgi:hypothetical protein